MKTKNKFANPPYLEEFNLEDAGKLKHILEILTKTCCRHTSPEGAIHNLEDLLQRPSRIRECDLFIMQPLVEAINRISKEVLRVEIR